MKKTVVIVEDNQLVASVYRSKLQAEGFSVEVAADGQAGLETIERARPDLVLLDLVLPKISGVEILEKLRARADFKNLPVIVFSSSYVSDEAWRAGATEVLNKASNSPKQVVEEVKNLLAASSSTQTADSGKPLNEETKLQAELQKTFRADAPSTISAIQNSLQSFIKTPGDTVNLYDLYRKIHAVSGNAGLSGLHRTAHLAMPLEVLLKELSATSKQTGLSVQRTVIQAVEFLIELLSQTSEQFVGDKTSFDVLVVDDEEIARRAVGYALEKAEMRALRVAESSVALKVLSENRFDILFLDIEMPEINGLELCRRLRELPLHAKTPIVFMTTVSQYEQYFRFALDGGNDIIAKPFHYAELVVKALTLLFKSRTLNPAAFRNSGGVK